MDIALIKASRASGVCSLLQSHMAMLVLASLVHKYHDCKSGGKSHQQGCLRRASVIQMHHFVRTVRQARNHSKNESVMIFLCAFCNGDNAGGSFLFEPSGSEARANLPPPPAAVHGVRAPATLDLPQPTIALRAHVMRRAQSFPASETAHHYRIHSSSQPTSRQTTTTTRISNQGKVF